MERPIREMLDKAAARLSLHMPGGQGKPPFEEIEAYRLDTTELAVTDDLYKPVGAIGRAQALAAISAGVKDTLFLHGGSTAGMYAMLLYAARRGDKVILPRNTHISALNVCGVAGIHVVFPKTDFLSSGRVVTQTDAYERAMEEHPDAKAVLVLRPDYYGLLPELLKIAKNAREKGMLVLCDEAHGATFNWRKDVQNAGALGADLFVQSAHKTLPALTAGAWLHAGKGVDTERLRRILRMVQTSSPSFLQMCALDDARAWMDIHGSEACEGLLAALQAFRRRAAQLGYGDGQKNPPEGFSYDPLRLVLSAPQGGYALETTLRSQGIDVELADAESVVCILSLMDGKERLEKLLAVLRKIPAEGKRAAMPILPALPMRVLSLSEAAFAPCEAVSMEEAVGRVSAAHVGLYPPGVALCAAGEVFSRELVGFFQRTEGEAFGLPYAGHLLCVIM